MSVRRYLRAARSLFEIQFQMKRPSAILKTKPNTVRKMQAHCLLLTER